MRNVTEPHLREHGGSRPVGGLMVLSSWLLTPFGVVLDIFAFRLDQPTNLKNLWTPILGVVVALTGLGAILLGRYLRRQGKRLISAITSLAAVLAAPPFVLYLRSFADDPRLGSIRLHWRERLLYRGKDFGSLQIRRTEEEQLRVAAALLSQKPTQTKPNTSAVGSTSEAASIAKVLPSHCTMLSLHSCIARRFARTGLCKEAARQQEGDSGSTDDGSTRIGGRIEAEAVAAVDKRKTAGRRHIERVFAGVSSDTGCRGV